MTSEIFSKTAAGSDTKTNILLCGFAIAYALSAYCVGASTLFLVFPGGGRICALFAFQYRN